jgi:hypothetical protein
LEYPDYIINAEAVYDSLGEWSTFHGAEVAYVQMRTNPHYISIGVSVASRLKNQKICIEFTFAEIEKAVIDNFLSQNIIFDLQFRKKQKLITTQLDCSEGLIADIICKTVSVAVKMNK